MNKCNFLISSALRVDVFSEPLVYTMLRVGRIFCLQRKASHCSEANVRWVIKRNMVFMLRVLCCDTERIRNCFGLLCFMLSLLVLSYAGNNLSPVVV